MKKVSERKKERKKERKERGSRFEEECFEARNKPTIQMPMKVAVSVAFESLSI
jgi:hypothetical protein